MKSLNKFIFFNLMKIFITVVKKIFLQMFNCFNKFIIEKIEFFVKMLSNFPFFHLLILVQHMSLFTENKNGRNI